MVDKSREDGVAMSLFDGKPLNEKDTPDIIYGKIRRLPVTRRATVEVVIDPGDSMCKHGWMDGTAGTRFCICCHRRVRVEEA